MKTYVAASSDVSYKQFESLVANRVQTPITNPIFNTNAEGLFDAYLGGLEGDRQHYNCKCCQRFVEKFGNLATVSEDGSLTPLIWTDKGDWPAYFARSLVNMSDKVCRAKITGIFINDEPMWGTPQTGDWTHIHGTPAYVMPKGLKTAFQVAADKNQDFGILKHGMSDYDLDVVKQAVRVLDADALDRSEKTLGIANWLMGVHMSVINLRGPRRDNMIWLAVATAPVGWCHIRSTMISTLLDDIKQGLNFEAIKERWARKMHPLQYMRPTAPISTGQVEAGNKRISEMAAEGSLQRRFAKLEEIVPFWMPQYEAPIEIKPQGGVFDHLIVKSLCKNIELPTKMMTWARFKDEILSTAMKLELLTPMHGAYFGMVTAVNADAPPLMQWDTDPRNPVSWFFFHSGSPASKWSLKGGVWTEINALCYKPPHWYHPETFKHEEEAVMIVLQGARLDEARPGGSFFPESLRSEFREIRAAMEAYSNKATVAGHEEGTANGYSLQRGSIFNVSVRVNGDQTYKLDRWH